MSGVLSYVQFVLQPLSDCFQRRTRTEDLGHTLLTQSSRIGIGNDATAENQRVTEVPISQLLHHSREESQMRSRQQRQTDCIDIFLKGGFGNLFGRLMQTRVDDLETMITQRSRDGLRAAIVSIQTRFGNDYSIGPLHKTVTLCLHKWIAHIRGRSRGGVVVRLGRTPARVDLMGIDI